MRVRLKRKCNCGCDELTKWCFLNKRFNRYLHGHNKSTKGLKLSVEAKIKIGLASKGRKHTKETKKKMSLIHKGKIAWNRGLTHSKETRLRMSVAAKGKIPWNIGKTLSKEHKAKISKNNARGFLGKNHTEETKIKLSKINSGENGNNWRGGKSFEPYGLEFNDRLKEQIRKRDNYTCQECGVKQIELSYKLNVHHIDYNKKNNIPENLISLCMSCHGKTHHHRDYWSKKLCIA